MKTKSGTHQVYNLLFTVILTAGIACGYQGEKNPLLPESGGFPSDTAPPSSITITNITPDTDRITIEWDDPADADFSHISITWTPDGLDEQIVAPGTGTFTASGLDKPSEYTFRLVAVDDSGNRSAVSMAKTKLIDTSSPDQVVITGVISVNGTITINWNDPVTADFDHVVITWDPDGVIEQSVNKGVRTYSAAGLNNNILDYTFSIVSVDDNENESLPVIQAVPRLDMTPPSMVTFLTAIPEVSQITLNWTDPANADFDHVIITWSPDGTSPHEVAGGMQTYAATGLNNTIEYTFSFVTVDIAGNESVPVTITMKPANSSTPPTTYFIYTAADLNAVRGGVAGYDDWDKTDHYIMMNDIDLSGYASWAPLGSFTPNDPFNGTLDGNGYTITGLKINDSTAGNQGLFGYIGWNGVVKNLQIRGCDITVNQYAGCLAGRNNGTISNCYVDGNITCTLYIVGGLVGSNQGTIDMCGSAVTVIAGNAFAGGLVGNNASTGTIISNSYAMGDISGIQYIGGLVGFHTTTAVISNSYAAGNIVRSGGTSIFLGGLVGVISNSTIINSYYSGTLSAGLVDNAYGERRTVDQMKLIDTSVPTYTGWDFITIWAIDPDINDGYPYLRSRMP